MSRLGKTYILERMLLYVAHVLCYRYSLKCFFLCWNIFSGMVFSMCGLMMRLKWCAWTAVFCSSISFANSRVSDDTKQVWLSIIFSEYVFTKLSIFVLFPWPYGFKINMTIQSLLFSDCEFLHALHISCSNVVSSKPRTYVTTMGFTYCITGFRVLA